MARTSETAQEEYISNLLKSYDFSEAQEAREQSDQLNKTPISLSIVETQILSVLLQGRSLSKFVEIGTLTGHSGLFILKVLAANGTLWTLEKDPEHARRAEVVLKKYAEKLIKNVHVVVGDAQVTLPVIESHGPFDGVFIDGNKGAYGEYLKWAEKNIRTGGIIIADNIFLSGGVYGNQDTHFSAKQIEVLRAFNQTLALPDHYETCVIPTREGMLIAIKK